MKQSFPYWGHPDFHSNFSFMWGHLATSVISCSFLLVMFIKLNYVCSPSKQLRITWRKIPPSHFNGTDNNKNGFANMLASTAWSAHSSVLPSPGQFIGTVCMDAHVFPSWGWIGCKMYLVYQFQVILAGDIPNINLYLYQGQCDTDCTTKVANSKNFFTW